MPYRVMKDVWARCHPAGTNSHLLLGWWLLWNVANMVSWFQLTGQFTGAGGPATPETLIQANLINLFSDALFLVDAALVIILIWQITGALDAKLSKG